MRFLSSLLAIAALCLPASAQTVNLFNPATVKTGGPFVPSDTTTTPSNYFSNYLYEIVPQPGYTTVTGSNRAGLQHLPELHRGPEPCGRLCGGTRN